MKTKIITVFLSLLFFGLPSCKNDGGIPEVALPDFMHVSLLETQNNPVVKKYDSGRDTLFVISAAYSGTNNYSQGDMEVIFDTDLSLVTTFNVENGTAYLPLPASAYELEGNTIPIADGANKGSLNMLFKTGNINPNVEYLLPVSIVSVTGKVPMNETRRTLYLVFTPNCDNQAGKETWTSTEYSSENGSKFSREKAYDDDENTWWQSGQDLGFPQWFIVDMKFFKRIDGFTLSIPGGVDATPKHIRIETGYNRTDWQTVLDIPELGQSPGMDVFPLEQKVIARYFKVTVESAWNTATHTCLAEVGIYSDEEPPEATTKMEKDTWTGECSSEWQDNHNTGPLKLLDDNNRSMWHSAPSANGAGPQWVLFDMQKLRKISGFKIWNRQDDHGREPKHILFELSADGVTWETLIDEENMNAGYAEEFDLPAPVPKIGRYLKMTILTTHYSTTEFMTFLAEVAPY